MTASARRRAERCFALARSTTFDGERKNAIAQGTKIAEDAGLSLDSFDIPGRVRKPTAERLFEGNGIFGSNFRYVDVTLSEGDILAAMAEIMASRYWNEPPYERRMREEREARDRRVDSALNFLFSRGVRMYRDDDGSFFSPDHHDPDARLSADDVLLAARARGWKP